MDDRPRSRPSAAPSPADPGAPDRPELEELGYAALPVALGPRRPRRWLSVALPVAALVIIVVAGFTFADPGVDAPATSGTPIAATPGDSPAEGGPVANGPRTPAEAGVEREVVVVPLSCERLGRLDCRRAAEAAIAILEPGHGPIAQASVWRSLICGSRWDCPGRWLNDGEAVGSVVLEFERGRDPVAVNVVEIPAGTAGAVGSTLQAWVTSWRPAPTLSRESDAE